MSAVKGDVGILATPLSNCQSVFRAFSWLDLNPTMIENPLATRNFSHLVVPGVSRFGSLMNDLNSLGFTEELDRAKNRGAAILGLCAGMQIMGSVSEESPGVRGLSWFDFKVTGIEKSTDTRIRNFHTGWNDVVDNQSEGGLSVEGCFYFNHSFYVPEFLGTEIIGMANYHRPIAAVIRKENLVGAQFHPEKSQQDGLGFLRSFARIAT